MKKLLLISIAFASLIACKKEDMSKYATKSDLQNYATTDQVGNSVAVAKTYDFKLNYDANFNDNTYVMPVGSMYGKTTLVYYDKGYKDWILLPFLSTNVGYIPVNFVAVINEIGEKIEVMTLRGDSQAGSPWTGTTLISYRAVVINNSAIKAHPNINFKDYKAVKTAFNL